MLKVGQTVKLMSLEKAKKVDSSVRIISNMEFYFDQRVTISEIHSRGEFKIEGLGWYFSPSWIDTESNPYSDEYLQQVNSTSYFNQHTNFLGETFCINNITFFKDSNGIVHMLPQQLI